MILGMLRFSKRQRGGRNGTKNCANAIQVTKCVNAKARYVGNLVGEIRRIIFIERSLGDAIHDFENRYLGGVRRQVFFLQDFQVAVHAGAYRIPGDEMQVRGVLLERLFEVMCRF